MLWIIPTWLGSLVAVFWLGYFLRGLVKRVEELGEVVKLKVDKKSEPEEPKSMIIDPTDPLQEALWRQQEEMRRLNPGD